MEKNPCRDCSRRAIGCHGKNEDGTWRCEDHRKWQAAQAEKRAARIARNNAERDVEFTKRRVREVAKRYAADRG